MKKIELFKGIKENDLEILLECLDAKSEVFPRDTYIIGEGEPIKSIGILLVGEAQIEVNNQTIETITAGKTFNASASALGVKYSPYAIKTKKQTGVLFLDYKNLFSEVSLYYETRMKLIKNIFELMAEENMRLSSQLGLLGLKTTKDKLLFYLENECKKAGFKTFEISYDRESLAKFLNVDRSAMCRELSRLHEQGIIEYKKNKFTFLN